MARGHSVFGDASENRGNIEPECWKIETFDRTCERFDEVFGMKPSADAHEGAQNKEESQVEEEDYDTESVETCEDHQHTFFSEGKRQSLVENLMSLFRFSNGPTYR